MGKLKRDFLIGSIVMVGLLVSYIDGWTYGSSNSLCYGGGKAFRCLPEFMIITENMMPDQQIPTCGQHRKQRLCSEANNCHSCMRGTHDAKYLTDRNTNNNVTYWASGLVNRGESITFSYSFDKLFEIYYISLVFLHLHEPDSIVIEKSMDYGKNWTVWHYFSKDCVRSFGLKPSMSRGYYADKAQGLTRKKCSPLMVTNTDVSQQSIVAAFTPISDARLFPSNSVVLLNFMSASNIRITLKKFKTNEHSFGFTYPPIVEKYWQGIRKSEKNRTADLLQKPQQNPPGGGAANNNAHQRRIPSLLRAGDYFAISDISVGGRCQCYGHASRCARDPITNRFACDCQHNTAGRDCESCGEGFIDTPWTAATRKSAAECKRCNCNLHSTHCKFDKHLFTLSKYKSGGICEKCKHNTAGRYCHYCKKGYFRDWSKPLSHQFVCLECRCHPIGSKSTWMCDQRNSQCICKTGVTGLSCNRCQEGYTQTTSPAEPCVKNYDIHRVAMAQPPENSCQQCNSRKKRMRFKKYCRRDGVMLVTLKSSEQHKKMVKFEMKINHVWRINKSKFRRKQPDLYAAINSLTQQQSKNALKSGGRSNHIYDDQVPGVAGTFPLWLPRSDLECGCPGLKLGVLYLVVLKLNTRNYLGRNELVLDQKSVAVKWQKRWIRRLANFRRRQLNGECKRFEKRRRRKYKNRKRRNNYYYKGKYSPSN